jgi:carboxyl-terminal processing protease
MKHLILATLIVWTTPLLAQQEQHDSQAIHGESLLRIAALMERDHLAKPEINDEIGRRWLGLLIDDLDPWRIYFTREDIRRFEQHRNALDEQARRGDLAFADLIRETYSKRLREATEQGLSLLQQQHDFTTDEAFELRPEAFPEDREAQSERRRKYVKYQMLVERLQGRSFAEAAASLSARYRRIASDKSFEDDNQWYEIFLDAFARSFDPQSGFLGERTLVHFRL